MTQIDNNKSSVKLIDWIIYAILAIFCFLSMQHPDLLHTGGSSFALLRGHILDFYEYNAQYFGGNNYMISTYILFAIWNIPLQLLGQVKIPTMDVPYWVMLWYKLLPTLFFLFSAVLVYQICKKFEKQAGVDAKWGAYIFLSTPVAFFSQYIFGQYDVFTVFFSLLAIKMYLKDDESLLPFSLIFGFATTFKYHAFFVYLPLLLYKEKDLFKICKNAFFYILPIVLVNLPFIHSQAFMGGVADFGAKNYVFYPHFDRFSGEIYVVPLLWAGICGYAYLIKPENNQYNSFRYVLFLANLSSFLAFGLTSWHPQWMMIAAPYLALSLYVSDRKDILCVLDIVLMFAFINFTVITWKKALDEALFNLGIFREWTNSRIESAPITMRTFFPYSDLNMLFTVFSSALLVRSMFTMPWGSHSNTEKVEKKQSMLFRVRGILGICIVVIPMIISLVSTIVFPTPSLSLTYMFKNEGKELELNLSSSEEYSSVYAEVWLNGEKWHEAQKSEDGNWKIAIDTSSETLEKQAKIAIYYQKDEEMVFLMDREIPLENKS